MHDSKPVRTPLGAHFSLSAALSPSTDEDRDYMSHVPYASAVGSIMYAMVCTRPDISHAVSVVSRYMANPGKEHWQAVKWILRYLKGTPDFGLVFSRDRNISDGIVGYYDSYYASDTGCFVYDRSGVHGTNRGSEGSNMVERLSW